MYKNTSPLSLITGVYTPTLSKYIARYTRSPELLQRWNGFSNRDITEPRFYNNDYACRIDEIGDSEFDFSTSAPSRADKVMKDIKNLAGSTQRTSTSTGNNIVAIVNKPMHSERDAETAHEVAQRQRGLMAVNITVTPMSMELDRLYKLDWKKEELRAVKEWSRWLSEQDLSYPKLETGWSWGVNAGRGLM